PLIYADANITDAYELPCSAALANHFDPSASSWGTPYPERYANPRFSWAVRFRGVGALIWCRASSDGQAAASRSPSTICSLDIASLSSPNNSGTLGSES